MAPRGDLIFDALTFPLGAGTEELRDSAMNTLNAIREIKRIMPRAKTILGLSNCSFGLSPATRQVVNSVFLHHAVEAGLDMAIVHAFRRSPADVPPGRTGSRTGAPIGVR